MKDTGIHLKSEPAYKATHKGRFFFLSLFFLSFIGVSWAQPGLVGRIVLNIDDPSVTGTVDKPTAPEGEPVTLTLSGLQTRQSVVVTGGLSALASDYPIVETVKGTYTFRMPSSTLYINVHVETSGYLVRVQTPGVGASLAAVKLERQLPGGAWETVEAGTSVVAESTDVRASLSLSVGTGYTLSLREVTGYASDGSWSSLPVKPEGGKATGAPSVMTFRMPASDVVLRYMIGYEAMIADEPMKDGPGEPKAEVPEIVWPEGFGKPEEPVLVITKEIEENDLRMLQEELAALPPDDPGGPDGTDDETITELVDISLRLQSSGQRVQPGDGQWVTVTYPYPQGTDGTWNFKILHMISDDPSQPLAFETIHPESLYIGLRFRVSSFSPFAIMYTPPVAPEGGGDPVRVTGVALSRPALSLEVGGGESLTATVTPTDATDRRLAWSSSDEGVATVSSGGKVTALSVGTARVTVHTLNGGCTASCEVTVSEVGGGPVDPSPGPDPVGNAVVETRCPVWNVSAGRLVVTSPVPVALRVHDASGRQRMVEEPSTLHRVALSPGLWLVCVGEGPAQKIVIP